MRRVTNSVANACCVSELLRCYRRGDERGYSGAFQGAEELTGDGGAWDDGSGGFEWKARHLEERRAMAMNYMGDVRKRVPIHNAIRMRSRENRERLVRPVAGLADDMGGDSPASIAATALSVSGGRDLSPADAARDAIDCVEEEWAALLADEEATDSLAALPEEDLEHLRHEFHGGAPELHSNTESLDPMLRSWLALRKESSMLQAFGAVPPGERREWSAWYLRDVQARKPE